MRVLRGQAGIDWYVGKRQSRNYATSSNSFFLMRAAAKWSIRRGLQSQMQELEFVALNGPLNATVIATL